MEEVKKNEVIEKKNNIVVRLNTVNVHSKLEVDIYELPKTEVSEYVVDDSNFIPMSEAIKQLGSNNIAASSIKDYYDFPDGRDNGMKVPITRTKAGKDIAEISSDIMNDINNIADNIQKTKESNARKAAFDKKLADIKASSTSSAPKAE